jgi:hypothetical protein
MNSSAELKNALNYLANNWQLDPVLRASFTSIIDKLKLGTNEEKADAQRLENYLAYPGSDEALRSVVSLNSALTTKEGRRASGLAPRVKGKSYPADTVAFEDKVMQVLIRYELGQASYSEVESAVIEYNGVKAVGRTNKQFINELLPRAREFVNFYKSFTSAHKSGDGAP